MISWQQSLEYSTKQVKYSSEPLFFFSSIWDPKNGKYLTSMCMFLSDKTNPPWALSQRLQIWTHTPHQSGSESYYLIIGVDPYIENYYLAIFLPINCNIVLSYMFKNVRAIFSFFLSQDRASVSISSQLYSYKVVWNGLFQFSLSLPWFGLSLPRT